MAYDTLVTLILYSPQSRSKAWIHTGDGCSASVAGLGLVHYLGALLIIRRGKGTAPTTLTE